MRKLTREFCCFRVGDSPTVYWVGSESLPLGEFEHEDGFEWRKGGVNMQMPTGR